MRKTTRVLGALAIVAAASVLIPAPPALAATATTTSVASSANPSTVGQAVTLTATVTGDAPTGSVTFAEPSVSLGSVPVSGGVATLVVSSWAAGTHAVTATYSGDSNNNTSAGALSQTVVAPAPPPAKHVKKPMVQLRVSSDEVEVGDKVRLSWSSKHADVVKASGDWIGKQEPKGSRRVRIGERGKHVFKLTVKNASGIRTSKVTVMASRKAKEFELVVTEEPVTVGDQVDVTADGLAAEEDYTLRLNGKTIATGTADKRGQVAETIAITKDTPEGAVPLTLTGSNPRRVGTAVLDVIKAKTLDVEAESAQIQANTEQKITVTGLLADEEVTVTYHGKKLTTGTADDTGTFTFSFDVGKKTGKQTVSVVGSLPTRTGKTTFKVLPGRAPGDGG